MWETEKGWEILAAETLKARYLREGESNWEDICRRVAKAIATNEEEYLEFINLMARQGFPSKFSYAHECGYGIWAAFCLFCYSY